MRSATPYLPGGVNSTSKAGTHRAFESGLLALRPGHGPRPRHRPQPLSQPYVHFEMTTGGERVSFNTRASKFPSSKNANFAERKVRMVLLPDDPLFAPQLCIKVRARERALRQTWVGGACPAGPRRNEGTGVKSRPGEPLGASRRGRDVGRPQFQRSPGIRRGIGRHLLARGGVAESPSPLPA